MTATPDLGTSRLASPDLFRSVFRQHAAGVAVITAQGSHPVGFTATSLTSVAADPPLLSFGVGTGSSSWPVHRRGRARRRAHTRRAPAGAGRHLRAQRCRPLRPRPPVGAPGPRGCRCSTGYWPGWCAGWWRGYPAGDHRIVIAEAVAGDPGGRRPSAALPPGALQRAARLRAPGPCYGSVRAVGKVTVQSSLRMGNELGVLASNISRRRRGHPGRKPPPGQGAYAASTRQLRRDDAVGEPA